MLLSQRSLRLRRRFRATRNSWVGRLYALQISFASGSRSVFLCSRRAVSMIRSTAWWRHSYTISPESSCSTYCLEYKMVISTLRLFKCCHEVGSSPRVKVRVTAAWRSTSPVFSFAETGIGSESKPVAKTARANSIVIVEKLEFSSF